MSEKPSNSKGDINKDLDDLLDSKYSEIEYDHSELII